ncbi:MAG: hypothetical protein GDA53_04740 [Rhodobacteraceae bacterium]|nr:hypothetical protein [Paracoccaceae bacterium]
MVEDEALALLGSISAATGDQLSVDAFAAGIHGFTQAINALRELAASFAAAGVC